MTTVLVTLRELHQLLVERTEAGEQLERLPLQLSAKKLDVKKKEAALLAEREELKKLKVAGHENEVALKGGEQKVRDYKAKLNQAKSNKEYAAIQEEIKNFQAINNKLEEEGIEQLTRQEEKSAKVDERAAVHEQAVRDLAKLQEDVDYRIQKLKDRLTLLNGKISEIEAHLDTATMVEYKRSVKALGARALAACQDAICLGCHTEQTPQVINELMMQRLIRCKSCNAILYSA